MLLFQNIPDYDTTGFHSTTTFIAVSVCVYIVDTFYWLLRKFNILPPPPREIRGIISFLERIIRIGRLYAINKIVTKGVSNFYLILCILYGAIQEHLEY